MNITQIIHGVIALAGIASVTVLAATGHIDGTSAVGMVGVLAGVSGGVAATSIGATATASAPATAPPANPFAK